MRFFFGCLEGVRRICAQMMTILHIKTSVTLEFDPPLFQN